MKQEKCVAGAVDNNGLLFSRRSFLGETSAVMMGAAVLSSPFHALAAGEMSGLAANKLAEMFAPTGMLRASINTGNPVLAKRDAQTGELGGVSVDIARELARRLGVEIQLLGFDAARKSVEAVETGQADIGFFAIDPVRGQLLHFSPPYLTIEASYLVRRDSPIVRNEDVDRPGNRVVVGKGSAYDLFLSRELRFAEIVRAPTPGAVVDMFVSGELEVAAGVRQQLQADLVKVPGARLLDGRFMAIHQAMGLLKTRTPEARQYLNEFVESIKSSGFIESALRRHGIQGAIVAPAGYPA